MSVRILLGVFLVSVFCVMPLHAVSARSRVQFVAVESTGVVHWPAGKPVISFPYNEKNRPTGLVIFEGSRPDESASGPIIGGTIIVQPDEGGPEVLRDVWSYRLVELGLVDLTGQGNDDIYFVSMEGESAQDWHFNLFNPRKAELITLSYHFTQHDQTLTRTTSETYDRGELKRERVFLDEISSSGDYPIPDIKKWLRK